MDFNNGLSRSFDFKRSSHDKSTVFETTLEHSKISLKSLKPIPQPLDLNRNPTTQRSSNTFKSEIFKPPPQTFQKFHLNRPLDHSPKDFYELSSPDFYRKSKVSDFEPSFTPNYTYRPTWDIPSSSPCDKLKAESSIRAIKKAPKPEPASLNDSYIKNSEKTKRISLFNDSHTKDTDSPRKVASLTDSYIKTSDTSKNLRLSRDSFTKNNEPLRNSPSLNNSNVKNTENPRKVRFDSTPDTNSFTQRQSTPTQYPDLKPKIRPITPKLPPRSISPSTNIRLNLTGLTPQDSEFSLRELCKSFQIISVSPPTNNVTGACTGSASITLKTSEINLKSFESELKNKGFNVSTSFVSVGKKNNYKDLANVDFLNKFVSRNLEKTPVRHHLESSQDVFGSSPGVGRCHSGKRVSDKQAIVLQTWNSVKNPKKKENETCEKANSLPSYMRSTQSSARKFRKDN